jgi:hypothetical protein
MTIIGSQSHPVKPSKQPAAELLSYRVEAAEPRLTGFGGAGLLAQFRQRLGLPQLLAALPNLPRTRYPAARFLLGLLYGLVLDRSRQAHVSELGEDAVFLRWTGLKSLPSQSAFSRFLARLRAPTAQALLESNRADLAGAQALFEELRRWLKRVGFAGRLQFRADNGFYAGWLLDHLERAHTTYAIIADLGGLALTLVGLKYRPLDTEYAVAEFWHRGAGWKRARRMIAIRRRLDPKEPKRGKQLRLFEAQGYSWQVIVTNSEDAPEEVWRFYNGRCNVENLIKEGRLGLSMDEVCSHSWAANMLHNWLALLAGNIAGWFGEYVLGLERRHSIAAVRERLLRIPARLIRTGRQWVLRLSAYYAHLRLFQRAHQRLRAGPIFA